MRAEIANTAELAAMEPGLSDQDDLQPAMAKMNQAQRRNGAWSFRPG